MKLRGWRACRRMTRGSSVRKRRGKREINTAKTVLKSSIPLQLLDAFFGLVSFSPDSAMLIFTRFVVTSLVLAFSVYLVSPALWHRPPSTRLYAPDPGELTMPAKRSALDLTSSTKKRKGLFSVTSKGGMGSDLVATTAAVAAAASVPSSFTSHTAM